MHPLADAIRARNELLPGLRGMASPDVEFDIAVDGRGSLTVIGRNSATGKSVCFDITGEQIESGAYKAAFAPGLVRLKEWLGG